MIKKVEIFLYNRLLERSFINDHEKYLFLISLAACIYAVAMHLFLLFFHLFTGVLPLFYLSLCGFLTDIFLFWLVSKRCYPWFGILLSVSVIVHTVLSAIGIGINNFIIMYPVVTLMMQIIIPYARARIRVLMIAVLWACMMALVFINRHMVPVWDIGEANTAFTVFNIQLAFFAILIQLTIGNTIVDTIMKMNNKELEKSKDQANMDSLTGLFNRRYAVTFFERISKNQDERVWCVAMLDIDDFKLVNDTYGHQVGDGVLISLSNIITTNLRKTDVVFRWGGEEFLILLKDVDVPVAFRILDKLRSKIKEETMEIHGKAINITVTIGVCSLDIHNVEQSIHMSDVLMYKGKSLGKNTVMM